MAVPGSVSDFVTIAAQTLPGHEFLKFWQSHYIVDK